MHEHRPAQVVRLALMFRGLANNVAVEGLGHSLSGSQPVR